MFKYYIEIGNRSIPCHDVLNTSVYIENPKRKTNPKEDIELRLDRTTIEAIGGKIVEIPDWEPGTEILTCDGDTGTYVGPTKDGLKAVLQSDHAAACEYDFIVVHWCDCGPLSEAEKKEAAVYAAFPNEGRA